MAARKNKRKVTLEDFENSLTWASLGSFDDDMILESKLSVLSDIDKPSSPAGEAFQGYLDEVQYSSQSAKHPTIKWTHTQTAGAGNKDAYDVHGWRAHGHEFTDDNATKLLIHGDLSESANTTNLTAKGYQFDGTNDNIDLGDLHGAVNYVWNIW